MISEGLMYSGTTRGAGSENKLFEYGKMRPEEQNIKFFIISCHRYNAVGRVF